MGTPSPHRTFVRQRTGAHGSNSWRGECRPHSFSTILELPARRPAASSLLAPCHSRNIQTRASRHGEDQVQAGCQQAQIIQASETVCFRFDLRSFLGIGTLDYRLGRTVANSRHHRRNPRQAPSAAWRRPFVNRARWPRMGAREEKRLRASSLSSTAFARWAGEWSLLLLRQSQASISAVVLSERRGEILFSGDTVIVKYTSAITAGCDPALSSC